MNKSSLLQKAIEIGKEKGFVDVVRIANDLGIQVFKVSKPDTFNADITFDKDTQVYTLLVNDNHTIGRQRFSVAHELGHFVLHHAELTELGTLNRSGDSIVIEEQADTLAAEILMPHELIQDFFEEHKIDLEHIGKDSIETISQQFKVSRAVAIIRLRELEYYVPYISFS